jgi:hypothetical protein
MRLPARLLLACTLLLLLLLLLLLPPAARAQDGAPSENAVKAAYLYKLRNYVEWPARAGPGAEAGIAIGIVGAADVAERLLQIPAVRQGRDGVVVKRLRGDDPLDGINILFVGDDAWRRSQAMIARAASQSILVVSESDNALAGGSVVNFRHLDEHVRFEISLDAADRSGLKLSSRLLALAVTVAREKRR